MSESQKPFEPVAIDSPVRTGPPRATVTLLGWTIGMSFFAFALTLVGIPVLVFGLDVSMNLATGIQWIDSMLYSLHSPISIFIVAGIWAFVASSVGAAVGLVFGVLAFARKRRRWSRR